MHTLDHLVTLATTADSKDGFAALDEQLRAQQAEMAKLYFIHAAHAYGAVTHNAGDAVGATNARTYLTETLGISNREAAVRIKRGQVLLQKLDSAEEQTARDQVVSLLLAGEVSLEKFDAINIAIDKMPAASPLAPEQLRLKACQEAVSRPVEDLRAWLGQEITTACQEKDIREHVRKKRAVRFGPEDAYGGVKLYGYLPTATAAIVKHALEKAVDSVQGVDRMIAENGGPELKRSTDQLYADALRKICAHANETYDEKKSDRLAGTASLVIGVTVDQLALGCTTGDETCTCGQPPAPVRFPTSAGVSVSAAEALELLGDAPDWLVVHDSVTGFPLAVGRAKRSATIAQRIALFAHQGVCAHPGCNRSVGLCQVHHIRPWKKGGRTDLENLTLLCTYHHGFNDDDGGSSRRGRIERNLETMDAEYVFNDRARVNDSVGARKALGRQIASGPPAPQVEEPSPPLVSGAECQDSGLPDPGLFDPPE